MPRKGKGSDKNYLLILKQLRRLIESTYKDGGWLPSGRKLSEQLGTDRGTLLKAIECVKKEGLVRSYPQKGYFVAAEKFRIKKVGIVLDNGEASPFLGDMHIFNHLYEFFKDYGYLFQLIQGNTVKDIFTSAVSHCVEALIWIDLPVERLDDYAKVANSFEIPAVVVSEKHVLDLDSHDCICLAPDFVASNNKKLDLFESKGHRNIAYICTDDSDIGAQEFTKRATERGIKTFPMSYHIGENDIISQLAENPQVTAMVIDGGPSSVDDVCRQLVVVKETQPIDVFFFKGIYGMENCSSCNEVNVIGMGKIHIEKLAEVAVAQIINYLKSGEELKSRYVDWMEIVNF